MTKVKRNTSGLKPFPKGVSGNPSGKPKGVLNSSTRLKRILGIIQTKKNRITGTMEELSVAEQMDMALVVKALKGDVVAYREILDRMEGKSKQSVEVTEKVIKVIHSENEDDEA